MIPGGTQVLAGGEDVNVMNTQVVHYLDHLVPRLAQPHHNARLSDGGIVQLLGHLQHAQGPFVDGLRADGAVQPGHCFDIMIEDLWARLQDEKD